MMVPDTLGGKMVIEIGDLAFYELSNLNSVVFNNSLVRIVKNAFWGCSDFKSISLPSGALAIGVEVSQTVKVSRWFT